MKEGTKFNGVKIFFQVALRDAMEVVLHMVQFTELCIFSACTVVGFKGK